MKKLLLVFVILYSSACSFDNKTGLWKDASDISVDNQKSESISDNSNNINFEDVFTKDQTFNEEIEVNNLANFKIEESTKIANWSEKYAISTNNISNFSYSNKKVLLSRSSKLSRSLNKKKILISDIIFYKKNLISHDHKGTIFIYSTSLNKKVFEYNFYKKNFKNFNKRIYYIINENILYVADNLGYLYAFNLDDKSILWAKNYGIPFRSNLKFSKNQLFLANQDNVIYSINSKTGDKNWQYATGLTFLKSDFENVFALDILNNNLLFLNTTGQLYSINYVSQKINWLINFKNSNVSGDTELFLSQPIVIKNNSLIVTTEKAIISYNTSTGARNWLSSAEAAFKPLITSNYTYSILKNDLLICIDNLTGKIVWSKNIFNNMENKKIRNKLGSIIDFKMVNSELNIYSKNGHLLSFNPSNGSFIFKDKISKKGIKSEIVFLEDNMFFVDNNNRLLEFN
jgi:outer membrane protein assembly factor BamB